MTGRVDKLEQAEDAARREVFEETGFKTAEFIILEKIHMYFKPGKRRIHFEPCFGVEIRGGEPVLSAEHDDYAWLDRESALQRLSHSGLREALQELDEKRARREPEIEQRRGSSKEESRSQRRTASGEPIDE